MDTSDFKSVTSGKGIAFILLTVVIIGLIYIYREELMEFMGMKSKHECPAEKKRVLEKVEEMLDVECGCKSPEAANSSDSKETFGLF